MVNLVILGSGPALPVRGKGRNYRSNASLLIETKKGNIIIDTTGMIEEQLFKNAVDRVDAIILSHGHSDAVSGIKTCIERFGKIPVYASEPTFRIINKYYKDLDIERHEIKSGEEFEVLGINFTPLRVIHAEAFPDGKKFPCLGFRFNNMLYAEDMESIPSKSEEYFHNLNLMIVDSTMYWDKSIRGHCNTLQSLEIIKKYNPKKTILTQIGRSYPDYYKAQKKINEYCKVHSINKVKLAYDGMVIENLEKLENFKLFRYVGSKRLDADKILAEIPENIKTFFDPTTGSSAIAWRMKQRGAKVIVNDLSPMAYYYSKALLGNYKLPQEEFDKFLKASPVKGWLSKAKLKRPGSMELRKYIDGMSIYATSQKSPVKDFLLAICADMLSRFMGSFGVFRPYEWSIKSAVEFATASYQDILKKIVPGESIVTNRDIFEMEIPKVDFVYHDPPYDISEGEDVPYSDQYKNINSILMQETFKLPEFDRQRIPELLGRLAKKCKLILVSTSDTPYINYRKELLKYKSSVEVRRLKRKSRGTQPSSQRAEVREYTDLLWIAKDTKQLAENNERKAVYDSDASLIYDNEKKLIVKSKKFDNMIDKNLYLVDDEKCFGIIKLTKTSEIDLAEFEKLQDLHKVDNKKRMELYPNLIKLYSYEFEWIEHFPEPKLIELPKEKQDFIKDWQFSTRKVENAEDYKFHRPIELIDSIYEYNPQNLENEVLKGDFKLAVSYFSRSMKNEKTKFNREQIMKLATRILKEIIKRKKEGKMNWTSRQEEGSEAYKELWKEVDLDEEEKENLKANRLSEDIVSKVEPEVKEESEKLKEEKLIEKSKEIKNFPDRLQKDLNIAKDSEKWFPFTLQWHYRGDSLHCDMILGCPDEQGKLDHCEGFTILSPTSTDKSVPDLINREDFKNVRCLLKDSHNIDALKKEGIFDKEVYLIVGKGIYKPLIIEDHRIVLEFKTYNGEINKKVFEETEKEGIEINRKPGNKLKSLPDCISFHIAHIDGRWIILGDKIKKEDIKVS